MRIATQRGSQAVEFALVLPFMIVIIYAVLDFFFLAYNKAVITNASREAVRRAIILSASAWDPAAIKQVACNYVRNTVISVGAGGTAADCSGSTDPVIAVSPDASSPPTFNTPVTVTVNYTVRGFSLGTWWNLGTGPSYIGAPLTLTASTQMNHE
jgi:Flp pilus assembly protein TadG